MASKDMEFNNPLISVVVITYNSAAYILETLESIKNQTYCNLELIISDDFSKDDTVDKCDKWLELNKHRFRRTELIRSSKNYGTAVNLNKGIISAGGDWVKIIAGDDALFPNIISDYTNYIIKNPQTEFLHSKVVHYNEIFEEEKIVITNNPSAYKINKNSISAKEQFQILLRVCLIGAPSVMIKKKVFEKVGLFDEDYPLWEDRPMWLKITRSGIKLQYLDINGAKYRERTNSVARIKSKSKILSDFALQKNKMIYERYIHEFPAFEKLILTMLYYNVLVVEKLQIKTTTAFSQIWYKLFIIPLNFFNHKIHTNFI